MIATIVAWAATAFFAVAGLRAHLHARQLRRNNRRLVDRLGQATEDRQFVMWANWTMLTVTDNRGYVHAATLRQLYTTGRWDAIWDSPVAVAVWHGDPDTVHQFNADLNRETPRARPE